MKITLENYPRFKLYELAEQIEKALEKNYISYNVTIEYEEGVKITLKD